MKGLLVVCVLVALAYVQSAPVDTEEQQPAQVPENVEDVDDSTTSDEAQEVGKHHHPNHPSDHHQHDHEWDHHNHHNDDHHHHPDDHDNDHHHPDPFNLCAGARADRWHLPYPKDTHKFVKCDLTTGKGTVFTCPSGLVFNAAIQVCDYA